jgi:hypothetical protein
VKVKFVDEGLKEFEFLKKLIREGYQKIHVERY